MAMTGSRTDPLKAFHFYITFSNPKIEGGFSECSGLGLETNIHDYHEGGRNDYVWKFPTNTKQSNITLKRGIVDKNLWDWYYEIVQGRMKSRSGQITVYSYDDTQVGHMTWEISNAFPCKWQGPDLNAGQSNIAVETLELCHHGLAILK